MPRDENSTLQPVPTSFASAPEASRPRFDLPENVSDEEECISVQDNSRLMTSKPAVPLRTASLPAGAGCRQSVEAEDPFTEDGPQNRTVITSTNSLMLNQITGNSADSKVTRKYYARQNSLLKKMSQDKEHVESFKKHLSKTKMASDVNINESNANLNKGDIRAPLLKQISDDDIDNGYSKKSITTSRESISAEIYEKTKDNAAKKSRAAKTLSHVVLGVNICLVLAKIVASALSGSLSIFSSLADSFVDITSGLVITLATRAVENRDPYMYPRGRTRLQPIAFIVISTVMSFASVVLIYTSAQRIISTDLKIELTPISISIMAVTIVAKLFLVLYCIKHNSDPAVKVLQEDQSNDCFSNSAALACAGIAYFGARYSEYFWYADPIGAIWVSMYIIYSWYKTGRQHIEELSGKSADPEVYSRVTKLCAEHDNRIKLLDTVLVYHWGTQYIAEVHIVLDPHMYLKEAHDISESLQNTIESLPFIERAFVHTDYEITHQPQDEHKVV